MLYYPGAWGFPGGGSGKEPTCQCRQCKICRFSLWVGKVLWRTAWEPTPVFLPGASLGQRSQEGSVHRVAKSQIRLKWQHTHIHSVEMTPGVTETQTPICPNTLFNICCVIVKLIYKNVGHTIMTQALALINIWPCYHNTFIKLYFEFVLKIQLKSVMIIKKKHILCYSFPVIFTKFWVRFFFSYTQFTTSNLQSGKQ